MNELHGRPTAEDLLEAVSEFLTGTLAESVADEHRFHLRVAVNVLGIVRREIASGPEPERRHREGLTELGYEDDTSLARAIRSGDLPEALWPVLRELVSDDVRTRVLVANPRYLKESS